MTVGRLFVDHWQAIDCWHCLARRRRLLALYHLAKVAGEALGQPLPLAGGEPLVLLGGVRSLEQARSD